MGSDPGGGMSDQKEKKDRPEDSMASRLGHLAEDLYTIIRDGDGTVYAVRTDGGRVAMPVADAGRSALADDLAAEYLYHYGRPPSRNAMSEALQAIRGKAQRSLHHPEPIALRHSPSSSVGAFRGAGALEIDLGRTDERVVRVLAAASYEDPEAVSLRDYSERYFRRTALTGQMPIPDRGADLEDLEQLRRVLNVADADWELVVGWMVAVLLGDIPVPIVLLTGEQGTGKSTAARILVSVVDPSPVPVRAAPKDLEGWIVAASGSRVVALDNLSHVPEWLSDALCRAVTGEGLVRRALYTNSDLAVTSFRRAIILTSIDTGALRGDLGERLVTVELERIDAERRLSEVEIADTLERILPGVFGGLLRTVALILFARADGIRANPRPRMADFADVLAALDHVTGWSSLDAYRANLHRTMSDLATGDQLAEAIADVARRAGTWEGSAADLLAVIADARPDDKRAAWPKTPKGLAGAVRRIAPSLRAIGVDVDHRRTGAARLIVLTSRTRDANDANDANDAPANSASVPTGRRKGEGEGSAEVADASQQSFASSASSSAPTCRRCAEPTKADNTLCRTCFLDPEEVPA
jgi:energy-coupling factor transporter ATP-binding protein EcfA2